MKWKKGDLAEVYDTWAEAVSVHCLPRNEEDNAEEIPLGTPVLILEPYSDEGHEKYGDHGGERWVLILWKEKEWFVYASDLKEIEKATNK